MQLEVSHHWLICFSFFAQTGSSKRIGLGQYLLGQPMADTLSEKRYKSCHWGCTFSKGKLLSILGANMDIVGANMYILGANMDI